MVTDEAIVARDGTRLPLRRWEATGQYAGKPRAVIVALHGMSDYSNAFAMPGAVWAKEGITTLAYDQRGFGKSEQPGIWAGADAMRSDLNDAVAAARARYPGVPVFALGESMGGAVVLTALASAKPPAADGIILVAPAVWSRADMPLTYRVALFLGAHLVPGMILSNNAAGRVVKIVASDNIPMLRALGRDPLFQKQTRTATLYGLVNLMDEARTAPDAYHRRAAHPVSLWRQRPDHSRQAHRGGDRGAGRQGQGQALRTWLSYAAARPGRRKRGPRHRRTG